MKKTVKIILSLVLLAIVTAVNAHDKIPVKPNDWNRLIFTYNKGAVTTTINGNPLFSPKKDVYTKHIRYFAINGIEADLLFIKSLKIVEL